MSGARPICFVNARMAAGIGSLRVRAGLIEGIDVSAARGDRVVDLEGDRLLPGLINAHDHLQFSNFMRTRFRDRHENVAEWIADVTVERSRDERLIEARRLPLAARLFAGGVKNLLSGATTVAHHDGFHESLAAADFPVRVLRSCGWAHSPALTPEHELRTSLRDTPTDWPWIVHAGEGVDVAAAAEFSRLEALGCIGARTLLVHALGFEPEQFERLMLAGAGVIWCPSSNIYLFGRTLDPLPLAARGRLGLGSDSRISGAWDLLAELRVAREAVPAVGPWLEDLVTRWNARLLRLGDRGVLAPGMLADLVVLPAGLSMVDAHRADLRLVLVGGDVRYGDREYATALGVVEACLPVQLDGREKILDRRVVRRLRNSRWIEPGLEIPPAEERAA